MSDMYNEVLVEGGNPLMVSADAVAYLDLNDRVIALKCGSKFQVDDEESMERVWAWLASEPHQHVYHYNGDI